MRNSVLQISTSFSEFSIRQSVVTLSLLFILFWLVLSQAANIASATQAPTLSPPSIKWQHTYGDLGVSQAIQTSDGGYALTGTARYMVEPIGPWLLKTDSQGNEQWIQPYYSKYPNLNLGGAGPILQTTDGGYLLSGSFSNNTAAYLLKTDSKGNIQWIQNYPSREGIAHLIKTPDGGYAISGAYAGGTGTWLAKVDSTGAVQWSRSYDGVYLYTMVQTGDGGYAVIGSSYNVWDRLNTAILIKTDSQGIMIWNQTYGSSIQFISLLQPADEGYALAGNTFRTNSSQGAVLLTKTDSYGKVMWNQTYSQLGEDTAWSIAKTSDGGYALGCGNHFVGNLAKIDADGNFQWNISFSSQVGSVMQLSDGSYVFLAGNALIKTVSDTSLPSLTPSKTIPDTSLPPVTPTKTIPEFNTPVTILAIILITTTVISISLKYTSKHFQ